MDKVLRRAVIFNGLEPSTARALARRLRRVEFHRGQTIFSEEEPGDHLYVIISGSVRISRRRAGGEQHLMAILGASDVFGEMCLFDPGPREATATAMSDVRAWGLDRPALRAWINQRPEIIAPLLTMLARSLRRTETDLCDLLHTEVRYRVAKQLLSLADHCGTRTRDGIRLEMPVTEKDLAQLTASAESSVVPIVATFATRGWIRLDGQNMIITDPGGLAAIQRGR